MLTQWRREGGVRHAHLILLAFIRAHVTAASVLVVGTRLTALIGLQQMTVAVGAATGVASINRRASREQRDGLRGPAVVPQFSELWDGIVQIASAIETAG